MESLPKMRPKCRGKETVGKAYTCLPHLPPDNMKRTLEWSWFPWDIKVGVIKFIQILAVILLFTSYVCTAVFRNTGAAVFAVLLTLILPVLGYFAFIVDWNFRLREAMCFAAGKQIQAKETWFMHLQENGEKDRAKELYFTESFNSINVNVLKDGTVEFRNKGPEFSQDFSAQFMGVTLDEKVSAYSRQGGSMEPPAINISENV